MHLDCIGNLLFLNLPLSTFRIGVFVAEMFFLILAKLLYTYADATYFPYLHGHIVKTLLAETLQDKQDVVSAETGTIYHVDVN